MAAYSLQRLRTDHIDVYRPARLDSQVPIEETIGAIAEHGSRPATSATSGSPRSAPRRSAGPPRCIRSCDLQIEYSLISRGIEREILPTCRELGIGITAYGVLSRGLISGHWAPERQLAPGDFRSRAPRFQGENLEHNLRLVEALRAVADAKGA